MTRSQLRAFCTLVFGAFLLLYAAGVSRQALHEGEVQEDRLRELDDKIDNLETEVTELKSENERLELELRFRQR